MKRFITMILAIAMVITSVVVPTDKAFAETEPDGTYKERDIKGNIIYQVNPDGTYAFDKSLCIMANHKNKNKNYSSNIFDWDFNKLDIEHLTIVEGSTEDRYSISCKTEMTNQPLSAVFSSSDNNIVTIDKNGIMKGKKAGKTTIVVSIPSIERKVTIPVNVIKNENSTKEEPKKGDVFKNIYGKVSYDKKGNMICKIKVKNVSKYNIKFKLSKKVEVKITNYPKQLFKRKVAYTKSRKFTLKSGKTKTLTIKVKKSTLKGKRFNLVADDVSIGFDYSAEYLNKKGIRTGRCSCGGFGIGIDGKNYSFYYYD